MTNKFRTLLMSALLLACFNSALAANIIASLSRNPIMLDESFSLLLEADDTVSDPNLRVLEKDFDILNQSQSTKMSYVNGVFSKKTAWTISLLAKKTGSFTIPSIAFGNDSSPALRITVKPATQSPDTQDHEKEIYVESELKPRSTWVQAPLIYTVRLFSRVALSNLRGSELSTSDADARIEQLGEATTYEAIRGSLRYAVREMRYAIYPQHSGKLSIEPMIFEGRVNQNRSQSIFDQFMNTGELRRMRSERHQTTIKPRPAEIKASDWLPASQVRLSDNWSEDITQLKSGEPVTRTIIINANGPMAEQIPELKLPEIDGLKQYPNKPVMQSQATEKGVSSTQEIKVALIPTQAGEFKMPAISLSWWNTRKSRPEIAHLPEVILNVTGAPAPAQPADIGPLTSVENNQVSVETAINTQQLAGIKDNYWPWISLLLGCSWLLTLFALLRRRSPTEKKPIVRAVALKPLENTVRQHCRANDAAQTQTALLKWAAARWTEAQVTSLTDIANETQSEMASALQSLNTALYSRTPQNWNGKPLLQAFESFLRQKQTHQHVAGNTLEPLYKS